MQQNPLMTLLLCNVGPSMKLTICKLTLDDGTIIGNAAHTSTANIPRRVS